MAQNVRVGFGDDVPFISDCWAISLGSELRPNRYQLSPKTKK